MVSVLFDTNILIDYLNGVEKARVELSKYTDKAISPITWMEVMVGATTETEDELKGFLASFTSLPVDGRVASAAVELRKKHGINLPDAIVWATAQVDKRILITRDAKDCLRDEAGVRIPYP